MIAARILHPIFAPRCSASAHIQQHPFSSTFTMPMRCRMSIFPESQRPRHHRQNAHIRRSPGVARRELTPAMAPRPSASRIMIIIRLFHRLHFAPHAHGSSFLVSGGRFQRRTFMFHRVRQAAERLVQQKVRCLKSNRRFVSDVVGGCGIPSTMSLEPSKQPAHMLSNKENHSLDFLDGSAN